MANNLLATLDNVNVWLDENVSADADDPLLSRLIASASRFLYGYLQRPNLFQQTWSETYDGSGSSRLLLRQWPVISVSSLTVGTAAISPASSYGQSGYLLEAWDGMPPGRPQALDLFGHRYCNGHQNVSVSYAAGYVIQNEAQTADGTTYRVTPNAPHGTWAADNGVSYASGGALTPVASSPAAGQYVPPNPFANPSVAFYQFNAADANRAVLLTYSYIPSDIEQACVEIVAERYQYRTRIGHVSKSLSGQETISFSLKDMQDYIKESLQPYRRLPLC